MLLFSFISFFILKHIFLMGSALWGPHTGHDTLWLYIIHFKII